MPFLLRRIRWNRWARDFWSENTWLDKDDIPIDPFFDLLKEDKDGKLHSDLSMWLIEDNKSNLERVIAAIAAGCHNIDSFDYLLIDRSLIEGIKFKIDKWNGGTADQHANDSWHYNIGELSCLRLLNLIRIVLKEYEVHEEENQEKLIMDRQTPKRVKEFILNGVRSGWINKELMKLNPDEIKK